MINRVVLVGRLVRDADLRKTQNDISVASFTLAVDNRMKDSNGQRTTSFIPCTVWNLGADNLVKYTKKGSLIAVDGHINQRNYTNKEGKNVSIVEIVADTIQFLEPKSSNESPKENNSQIRDEDLDLGAGFTEDDLPF